MNIGIEISDVERPPAGAWSKVWLDRVLADGAAIGATDVTVTSGDRRLVILMTFPTTNAWRVFRDGSCISTALCAVPNPAGGLEVYTVMADSPSIEPHQLRVRLR